MGEICEAFTNLSWLEMFIESEALQQQQIQMINILHSSTSFQEWAIGMIFELLICYELINSLSIDCLIVPILRMKQIDMPKIQKEMCAPMDETYISNQ